MTCIVGIMHAGEVWIGGDSAGVGGYSLSHRADEKVFTNGEFVMGFTTSFRMGQILRYRFTPPPITTADLRRYMATEFIDAARSAMKDGGYLKVSDGREDGGTFLVGVRGQLFAVEDDFQVGVSCDGYDAVGCGHDIAKGALFATQGMPPEQRINIALEAAARFSAGVRPPFVVERTRG